MTSGIHIIRPAESWGDPDTRTHQQESRLIVEDRGGSISFALLQGATNAKNPEHSRPEAEARVTFSRADVVTLAAYLYSLPEEA